MYKCNKTSPKIFLSYQISMCMCWMVWIAHLTVKMYDLNNYHFGWNDRRNILTNSLYILIYTYTFNFIIFEWIIFVNFDPIS